MTIAMLQISEQLMPRLMLGMIIGCSVFAFAALSLLVAAHNSINKRSWSVSAVLSEPSFWVLTAFPPIVLWQLQRMDQVTAIVSTFSLCLIVAIVSLGIRLFFKTKTTRTVD